MDDPQHDDNEGGALYVKGRCFVCNAGTYSCYVCNGLGTTYVEASDRGIARWINNLNEERKSDIMKYIQKGLSNGKEIK